MSDLSQRGKAAPGAPHDTVPMGTDTNPPSSSENASEAAAEERPAGLARQEMAAGHRVVSYSLEPSGITARRSNTTARR